MSAKKLISDYFANLERIVALDEQLADANVAAKEAMVQIKKIYKDRPREVVLVGRGKSRRGIVLVVRRGRQVHHGRITRRQRLVNPIPSALYIAAV